MDIGHSSQLSCFTPSLREVSGKCKQVSGKTKQHESCPPLWLNRQHSHCDFQRAQADPLLHAWLTPTPDWGFKGKSTRRHLNTYKTVKRLQFWIFCNTWQPLIGPLNKWQISLADTYSICVCVYQHVYNIAFFLSRSVFGYQSK